MPLKSETTLPPGYQERPQFVRITVTLPRDLAAFAAQQAKRFPSLRGDANQSAYVRELVEAHRAGFLTKRKVGRA